MPSLHRTVALITVFIMSIASLPAQEPAPSHGTVLAINLLAPGYAQIRAGRPEGWAYLAASWPLMAGGAALMAVARLEVSDDLADDPWAGIPDGSTLTGALELAGRLMALAGASVSVYSSWIYVEESSSGRPTDVPSDAWGYLSLLASPFDPRVFLDAPTLAPMAAAAALGLGSVDWALVKRFYESESVTAFGFVMAPATATMAKVAAAAGLSLARAVLEEVVFRGLAIRSLGRTGSVAADGLVGLADAVATGAGAADVAARTALRAGWASYAAFLSTAGHRSVRNSVAARFWLGAALGAMDFLADPYGCDPLSIELNLSIP